MVGGTTDADGLLAMGSRTVAKSKAVAVAAEGGGYLQTAPRSPARLRVLMQLVLLHPQVLRVKVWDISH